MPSKKELEKQIRDLEYEVKTLKKQNEQPPRYRIPLKGCGHGFISVIDIRSEISYQELITILLNHLNLEIVQQPESVELVPKANRKREI